MSYNIIGLGKRVKRKEIKDLIVKDKIDMCYIQVTRLEVLKKNICTSIWFDNNFDWAYKASEGRLGEILTIWNNSVSANLVNGT